MIEYIVLEGEELFACLSANPFFAENGMEVIEVILDRYVRVKSSDKIEVYILIEGDLKNEEFKKKIKPCYLFEVDSPMIVLYYEKEDYKYEIHLKRLSKTNIKFYSEYWAEESAKGFFPNTYLMYLLWFRILDLYFNLYDAGIYHLDLKNQILLVNGFNLKILNFTDASLDQANEYSSAQQLVKLLEGERCTDEIVKILKDSSLNGKERLNKIKSTDTYLRMKRLSEYVKANKISLEKIRTSINQVDYTVFIPFSLKS